MNVTFLVEINLEDTSDLIGTSEDVLNDLSDTFDVVSVKPWARPTTAPLASALAAGSALTETPQQPEQIG